MVWHLVMFVMDEMVTEFISTSTDVSFTAVFLCRRCCTVVLQISLNHEATAQFVQPFSRNLLSFS